MLVGIETETIQLHQLVNSIADPTVLSCEELTRLQTKPILTDDLVVELILKATMVKQ